MSDSNQNAVATLLFASVSLLVGVDLLADAGSGISSFHVGTEALATLLALVGSAWFLRQLLTARADEKRWRARAEELLAEVGRSVDEQFKVWELTGAEREVALLLLKGLAFKEIGQVRDTSARTAREQARAVYRKAGVGGRAELAAWFIDDLLPPA